MSPLVLRAVPRWIRLGLKDVPASFKGFKHVIKHGVVTQDSNHSVNYAEAGKYITQ